MFVRHCRVFFCVKAWIKQDRKPCATVTESGAGSPCATVAQSIFENFVSL